MMQVIAAKALVARKGFDLASDKVKDLAAGAFVHVMETAQTSDGAHRIGFAYEGEDRIAGWVTAISKDGALNLNVVVPESRRLTQFGGMGDHDNGGGERDDEEPTSPAQGRHDKRA